VFPAAPQQKILDFAAAHAQQNTITPQLLNESRKESVKNAVHLLLPKANIALCVVTWCKLNKRVKQQIFVGGEQLRVIGRSNQSKEYP
jgi:hypothetical protein